MNEVITATAIAPVVVGLVQAVRHVVQMPSRNAPALSIVLGVVLALLSPNEIAWREDVWTGIIAGLTACGMYSGIKATAGR